MSYLAILRCSFYELIHNSFKISIDCSILGRSGWLIKCRLYSIRCISERKGTRHARVQNMNSSYSMAFLVLLFSSKFEPKFFSSYISYHNAKFVFALLIFKAYVLAFFPIFLNVSTKTHFISMKVEKGFWNNVGWCDKHF